MFDKKLVVIYFYSRANIEIASSDHKLFYDELKKYEAFEKNGIIIDQNYCPNARTLKDKLETLLEEPYSEIYLHFSGHGDTEGIPLGDWTVENENFAIMLDHPKIKSCFFSSCKSAELVKIVTERDIPIVIGTREDKNIENSYAIDFQKRFYKGLAVGKSFKSAFDDAWSDIETEKKVKLDHNAIIRGSVSTNEWQSPVLNKLQIVFSTKEEEKRHLIYPTVVEAMTNVEEDKQIIFAYAENEKLLSAFEEAFNIKGLHEFCKLFLLEDNDLRRLKEEKGKGIFLEDIKIIFIIQSTKKIFENEKLINIFDDDTLFSEKFKHLKFAVAVKEGIDESLAFDQSDYFKDEIKSCPKFYYSDFKQLFGNNDFDKFINEFEIDLSTRRKYLMKFPCEPTRDEVKPLVDATNYIRVFFASKRNEKLINYIINWLTKYLKIQTPIIIADSLHKENSTIEESLKTAIKNSFKDSPQKELFKQGLNFIMYHLIMYGHVIVFRTEIEDVELLKDRIQTIFGELGKIPPMQPPPPNPTFIFFINKTDYSFVGDTGIAVAKAKTFSPPDSVSKAAFEKWTDKIGGDDEEFDKLLQRLNKMEFNQFENKCPSNVIELICDEFKIPRAQVLNIS